MKKPDAETDESQIKNRSKRAGLKTRVRRRTVSKTHKAIAAPIPPAPSLPDGLLERMRASGERLPHQMQHYIVLLNASRMTPTQVVRHIKEHLGVDLRKQEVEYYDPTKTSGRQLRPELRIQFFIERANFDQTIQNISIASPNYRLRMLSNIAEAAMDSGNYRMALDAIELAEKIDGGAYKKATGPCGYDPLHESVRNMSDEERMERLHALIQLAYHRANSTLDEIPMVSATATD